MESDGFQRRCIEGGANMQYRRARTLIPCSLQLVSCHNEAHSHSSHLTFHPVHCIPLVYTALPSTFLPHTILIPNILILRFILLLLTLTFTLSLLLILTLSLLHYSVLHCSVLQYPSWHLYIPWTSYRLQRPLSRQQTRFCRIAITRYKTLIEFPCFMNGLR